MVFCSNQSHAKSLEFYKIFSTNESSDLSGLSFFNDRLVVVSDLENDKYIYTIIFNEREVQVRPLFDLKAASGFYSYHLKNLLFSFLPWKKHLSIWDIEGITTCKNKVFLLNEELLDVISYEEGVFKPVLRGLRSTIDDLLAKKQDDNDDKEMSSTLSGLEGIAIDCERNILYLAKEREPRALFSYNLKNSKLSLLNTEDFPQLPKEQDFSSLHFEYPYLYVLARMDLKIYKYHVQKQMVADVYDLGFVNGLRKSWDLKSIYNKETQFSPIDGMTMDKNFVYLVVDQNNMNIKKEFQSDFKYLKMDQAASSLFIIYKRPKDL